MLFVRIACICLVASTASAQGLAGLAQTKDATTMRASTTDPDWEKGGNADARMIEPGETLVLADLEGPGVINHIWFTINAPEKQYPRLLALRMYWDGEEHPSVESPIGDFFAVGHGMDVPVDSIPVAVTSEGRARNCYWPMPFAKRARIEVTNEGSETVNAFYAYIDWEKVASLPANTAYFHAMYRQEYPAKFDERYRYADIEGRGHYVGTVHSVRARTPGWIGEGDDFFYIDGEDEPRLKGTGTEDYFSDAWGFREMARPYYGAPIYEGEETGNRTSVYRWHVTDPIRFNKSLYAEIEHVGPNGLAPDRTFAGAYGVRIDDISSVAFWYQVEPHKPWEPMPVGHERLYPEDVSKLHHAEDPYPPYLDLHFAMLMNEAGTGTDHLDLRDAGKYGYTVRNPSDLPAEVQVEFGGHGAPKPEPNRLSVALEPGGSETVTIAFEDIADADPRRLQPVTVKADYAFQLPNGMPFTVPVHSNIVLSSRYEVQRATGSILIDGDIDDWEELPFVMTQPAQLQLDAHAWEGPDDCRFRFGVAHDADYLYIAVAVADDEAVYRADQNPWIQDGVEIRVTALPDAERDSYRGGGEFTNAILFALSPQPNTDSPVVFNEGMLPEGAQYACAATEGGFNAEIAIPAAYLNEQQGQPWEAIRLNIAVNDRDGIDQTQLWWRPDWRRDQSFDGSGTFVRK